jgi:hypothetical protein
MGYKKRHLAKISFIFLKLFNTSEKDFFCSQLQAYPSYSSFFKLELMLIFCILYHFSTNSQKQI